jgi:hypothetical protein
MTALRPSRRLRRAFSLLEVMIASAILLTTLVLVVRIQATMISGVTRADRIVVGTDLAREKMQEVLLLIEAEGLGTGDISERGDFRDRGDGARVDFGRTFDDYRWEYHVEEIEFQLNTDLFAMLGGGEEGADGGGGMGGPPTMGGDGMAEQMMNQMGLGGDQLSQQLSQFIRRVRVRVWWGESKGAEEQGREVVLTTHIISPRGAFNQMGGAGGVPGGAGGAPGGGAGGGRGQGGQGGFGPQGGMPEGGGGFRGSIGSGAGGAAGGGNR